MAGTIPSRAMAGRLSLPARARSFRYAFRGLAALLRTQPNASIHVAAAAAACGLAAALGATRGDWLWLVAAIAGVLAAEALNSALEALADAAHPAPHPLVARAKDLGAAAVLIAAAGAAAIGLLVLGPLLLRALGG
jgi:diacylglycerol kinase (ATP)